eukprot:jgi/Botrbrau1/14815/Bobra.0332s0008.1
MPGKAAQEGPVIKMAAYERANPDNEVTLDIMNELMQSAHDSQDRATTARNKLGTVSEASEPPSKYVEEITLFGEIDQSHEAHEALSMGKKLRGFKKGLREALQDESIIDSGTGLPYDYLDLLINALTKYEAALGGGQRPYKRTGPGWGPQAGKLRRYKPEDGIRTLGMATTTANNISVTSTSWNGWNGWSGRWSALGKGPIQRIPSTEGWSAPHLRVINRAAPVVPSLHGGHAFNGAPPQT